MISKYKLHNKTFKEELKNFNESCIGCNRCSCLMMKDLGIEMKSFSSKVLNEGFDRKEAFSCVECGQCNDECNLDVSKVFRNLKEDICCQLEGNKIFNTPYILHKQVKLKHTIQEPKSKILFMPGCTIKNYNPELSKNVLGILKSFNPEIELYEGCCTKPIKLLGKKALHESYLSEYEKKFEDVTVITACFSCTKILGNHVNTITLYEYMLNNNLVNDLKVNDKYSIKLPCHINKDYQEVCKSFVNTLGIKIDNTDNTCCGSGGLIGFSNHKLSKKYLETSINNLNADNIVCFCAECNSKINKKHKSKHILELLEEK